MQANFHEIFHYQEGKKERVSALPLSGMSGFEDVYLAVA